MNERLKDRLIWNICILTVVIYMYRGQDVCFCLVGLLICPTLKPLSYVWRILYHMHLAGGQILSPIIEVMTARYLLSQSPLTARVCTYDPDSINQVHSART